MSKVLVRKQMFDPKQAANNMAAVTDLSSGGAVEQLGLLNLLSGPQKPLAPAAAKELGYDMDSDEYKRLRTGERIGQGLAGLYGGYRMMDAIASGRSPTSAIGAGAGAYGSVAPIARRVGVRAASRGMKPAPQVAVAQPQPFRQPTPQEARVNKIPAGQTVFTHQYAGSQLPKDMPDIAAPTPNQTAEGFSPGQEKTLSGNVAVTQTEPKNQGITESQMKTLFDRYEDPDAEEKAREQGRLMGE